MPNKRLPTANCATEQNSCGQIIQVRDYEMNACFSPDNNYIYCTYKIHLFFQCQVREFAESCSNHEYAGIYIDLTGFDAVPLLQVTLKII